ncbi:hypothetical protein GH714_008270 [Hevea brasiliensis]|uniref:SUI1 domain-containing protein n=3 Tax=Crotonoideae TaxID=235631 RepID=A0A6A6KBU1_HEVBR|nr:hypothetical protein GH714_008270 [Hevea brasiliensis]
MAEILLLLYLLATAFLSWIFLFFIIDDDNSDSVDGSVNQQEESYESEYKDGELCHCGSWGCCVKGGEEGYSWELGRLGLCMASFLDQPSFMSELETQIPTTFDPFADANAEDSGAGAKEYVHIRIQQRNGRKSLTTVQGLKKEFSYNKILKDLKKEFCCNGTVVQDPELGQVIQLQGDQRKNVSTFLVQAGIVKKENIKIHGF